MQVLRLRGDDANLRITVESLRFSLIECQLYEINDSEQEVIRKEFYF